MDNSKGKKKLRSNSIGANIKRKPGRPKKVENEPKPSLTRKNSMDSAGPRRTLAHGRKSIGKGSSDSPTPPPPPVVRSPKKLRLSSPEEPKKRGRPKKPKPSTETPEEGKKAETNTKPNQANQTQKGHSPSEKVETSSAKLKAEKDVKLKGRGRRSEGSAAQRSSSLDVDNSPQLETKQADKTVADSVEKNESQQTEKVRKRTRSAASAVDLQPKNEASTSDETGSRKKLKIAEKTEDDKNIAALLKDTIEMRKQLAKEKVVRSEKDDDSPETQQSKKKTEVGKDKELATAAELPKPRGRGRPPKPKSDLQVDGPKPKSEAQDVPEKPRRGRPPKPKTDVKLEDSEATQAKVESKEGDSKLKAADDDVKEIKEVVKESSVEKSDIPDEPDLPSSPKFEFSFVEETVDDSPAPLHCDESSNSSTKDVADTVGEVEIDKVGDGKQVEAKAVDDAKSNEEPMEVTENNGTVEASKREKISGVENRNEEKFQDKVEAPSDKKEEQESPPEKIKEVGETIKPEEQIDKPAGKNEDEEEIVEEKMEIDSPPEKSEERKDDSPEEKSKERKNDSPSDKSEERKDDSQSDKSEERKNEGEEQNEINAENKAQQENEDKVVEHEDKPTEQNDATEISDPPKDSEICVEENDKGTNDLKNPEVEKVSQEQENIVTTENASEENQTEEATEKETIDANDKRDVPDPTKEQETDASSVDTIPNNTKAAPLPQEENIIAPTDPTPEMKIKEEPIDKDQVPGRKAQKSGRDSTGAQKAARYKKRGELELLQDVSGPPSKRSRTAKSIFLQEVQGVLETDDKEKKTDATEPVEEKPVEKKSQTMRTRGKTNRYWHTFAKQSKVPASAPKVRTSPSPSRTDTPISNFSEKSEVELSLPEPKETVNETAQKEPALPIQSASQDSIPKPIEPTQDVVQILSDPTEPELTEKNTDQTPDPQNLTQLPPSKNVPDVTSQANETMSFDDAMTDELTDEYSPYPPQAAPISTCSYATSDESNVTSEKDMTPCTIKLIDVVKALHLAKKDASLPGPSHTQVLGNFENIKKINTLTGDKSKKNIELERQSSAEVKEERKVPPLKIKLSSIRKADTKSSKSDSDVQKKHKSIMKKISNFGQEITSKTLLRVKCCQPKIDQHFKCVHCAFIADRKQVMIRHAVQHSGDIRFSCGHCLKEFNMKKYALCHSKRLHFGLPFNITTTSTSNDGANKEQISSAFTSTNMSSSENESSVKRERRYVCPYCDLAFCKYADGMVKHFQKWHPNQKVILQYQSDYVSSDSTSTAKAVSPSRPKTVAPIKRKMTARKSVKTPKSALLKQPPPLPQPAASVILKVPEVSPAQKVSAAKPAPPKPVESQTPPGGLEIKIADVRSLASDEPKSADNSKTKTKALPKTSCNICKSKFASIEETITHIDVDHNMEYWFACPYCPFGCSKNKDNMISHIQRTHPDKDSSMEISLMEESKYFTRLPLVEEKVTKVPPVPPVKKGSEERDSVPLYDASMPGTSNKRSQDSVIVQTTAPTVINVDDGERSLDLTSHKSVIMKSPPAAAAAAVQHTNARHISPASRKEAASSKPLQPATNSRNARNELHASMKCSAEAMIEDEDNDMDLIEAYSVFNLAPPMFKT